MISESLFQDDKLDVNGIHNYTVFPLGQNDFDSACIIASPWTNAQKGLSQSYGSLSTITDSESVKVGSIFH